MELISYPLTMALSVHHFERKDLSKGAEENHH
jgi:hypothetical protein